MTEIINLRRARKAKEKTKKEKTAAANRVTYGTPKPLRDLAKAQFEKDKRNLEGHKKD